MGVSFMIEDGYLFTNNHVLSNEEIAGSAVIEFNYEQDATNNLKPVTSYHLDSTDF